MSGLSGTADAARRRHRRHRRHRASVAERLEGRLLLHAGHAHADDAAGAAEAAGSLPAWHRDEHALAAAGAAGVETPAVRPATLAADAGTDPALIGQWGEVLAWPTVATHTHLLPSGKVLFWRAG